MRPRRLCLGRRTEAEGIRGQDFAPRWAARINSNGAVHARRFSRFIPSACASGREKKTEGGVFGGRGRPALGSAFFLGGAPPLACRGERSSPAAGSTLISQV